MFITPPPPLLSPLLSFPLLSSPLYSALLFCSLLSSFPHLTLSVLVPETVQDMFITPLYQQHASHTLASRVYGPRPHNHAELTCHRTMHVAAAARRRWWLTAATPVDNPYCSCELTRALPGWFWRAAHNPRWAGPFDARGSASHHKSEVIRPIHTLRDNSPRGRTHVLAAC